MEVLKNKTTKTSNHFSRYNGLNYFMNTLDILSEDKLLGSVSYKEQLELTKWLSQDLDYEKYICKEGDTYDKIALLYYNNPTYYWVICDFNRILDPIMPPKTGEVLFIPTLTSGLNYEVY